MLVQLRTSSRDHDKWCIIIVIIIVICNKYVYIYIYTLYIYIIYIYIHIVLIFIFIFIFFFFSFFFLFLPSSFSPSSSYSYSLSPPHERMFGFVNVSLIRCRWFKFVALLGPEPAMFPAGLVISSLLLLQGMWFPTIKWLKKSEMNKHTATENQYSQYRALFFPNTRNASAIHYSSPGAC